MGMKHRVGLQNEPGEIQDVQKVPLPADSHVFSDANRFRIAGLNPLHPTRQAVELPIENNVRGIDKACEGFLIGSHKERTQNLSTNSQISTSLDLFRVGVL